MLTSQEVLQELLLDGRKVNKFTFLHESGSVCLAQRVLELRQAGWNIRSRAIKGKGALREYWLEPEEIQRIKNEVYKAYFDLKPFKEVKAEVEQLTESLEKAVEIEDMKPTEQLVSECAYSLENEQKIYEEEQLGLGFPWE